MPDVDAADGRRGAQLFPVLFWGGVGLAPLAGLLILLGAGGTPVRIGAVLGVLAPVMIAVSFALRPNPDSIRLHFEETLLEELDLIRGEVREEIANSGRATHQMVGERLGALQQTVDTLRAAAATRAGPSPPVNGRPTPAAPYQVAAAAPVPPPVASRASVPRSAVPPASAVPPSAVPRSAAPPGMPPRSAAPPPMGRQAPPASAAPAAYPGNGRANALSGAGTYARGAGGSGGDGLGGVAPPGRRADGRSGRHQADGYPAPANGYPAPANGYPPPANGYNGGYGGYGGGEEWSPPAPRRRPAEPYEESWTDKKLRERYGSGGPRPYDRADDPSSGEPWRQREDGQWAPVSAEPASRGRRRRWEEDSSVDMMRGGDRRAGRHSGETGTQPRYDDRWSSGREETNGYAGDSYGGYGNGRPDYSRRALPAGNSEPSWNDNVEEPARDARSHRYRPDFELTDERWR